MTTKSAIVTGIPDKPEVRNFSEMEKAWLASTIDGEGSIGIYDYGREGRRICIQMGNTSEEYVKRMREIIGCGSTVYRHNFHNTHLGKKPMYHYALKGSARCYKVLKQIIPYLIIKKEKAISMIEEVESKPFGRWRNCSPESRAKSSSTMKEIWKQRKQKELSI